MITVKTENEKETKALAARLAKLLKPGDIVFLNGDLGTGKTTFVKGAAKHFKVDETKVVSPTYVLLNIYDGKYEIYHFDLYRLDNMNQINTIGYEEFFYGEGISFVEWPERLGDAAPSEYLKVTIAHRTEGKRTIKIMARGTRYKNLLEKIKELK